ncbi:amino acid adenylation domain-containing protein [Bradyrhizobium ontarionense]|uniref:Amino acid adenylation domain-containing protein n=1 Tax=Bradyrhizobium ontarionense TaxID=2898149 RepID=A0ABY3RL98_9BRAD|nr:non-ribosomal peptide synthetase [Bradyrhizobium sp. A19]UFZ08169.1 amino acid adenylation domain-containing protein [Bradyrhizobium sp. A19]
MGRTGAWHPLSHGQEALWFLWELAPESPAYNIVFPAGIRGELDVEALHRALQMLSDRHPCLRIEFSNEDGKLQQRAHEHHAVRFELHDASAWSRSRLDQAIGDHARLPFDLKSDAALRVTLFRRSPHDHVLLLSIPHIVSDLWSLIVLMDELRDSYAAETSGRRAELPPQPLSYEDYVRWQRAMLEGAAGDAHWRYWQAELAGDLPVLDLPADHARPAMQSFRGGTINLQIASDLTQRLQALARAENVTLFMALLAAFQALLHRYSGQDDIVVGAPTSGRNRAEFAGVVGDFVNMVPLRADFADAPSFRQTLAQSSRKVVGAIKHQDFPFSLLVDRLQPARDLSRPPIFQASFVLQTFHRFKELSRALLPGPDEPHIPFGALELEPWPLAQQEGQFDISLEMKEDESGRLMGSWRYAADLFRPETIVCIAHNFETLLREAIADPDRPINKLRLLTAEESRSAMASARGPAAGLPAATSICELFAAQAARRGAAIAVSCGDISVSYAGLDRRVEDIAGQLAALGVGADVIVAIMLPRGIDFVTALLATSRAGGAFLPLDPRHPLSRASQIFRDSRAQLVLTTAAMRSDIIAAIGALPQADRPRVIAVEEMDGNGARAEPDAVRGGDLAYVMYTSGSTGNPKGVMVEHRGMINHVLGKLSDLGFGEDDALAQNAPQSFDVVVWQSLAPLISGGRTVVIPDEVAEDMSALVETVERQGVTVLQLVPAMMRALIDHVSACESGRLALAALRWMVPTGEALPVVLVRRWLELYPHIPVLNTYGSTECSDDQCHYTLDGLDAADLAVPIASIGSPIQNMAAYVLDRNLAAVPAGVVGELYIGGIGVGRGYVNEQKRTASAFVPDPFSESPGARLYRTRDLARRRSDGKIDFLGRVDEMIKLHGFRIEPREIEVALLHHPAISKAAVIAREHPSGKRQLVAYVVPSLASGNGRSAGPAELEDIRRHLGEHLPLFMIPAAFCVVDALPLTANGKLDQRRLPAPHWEVGPADHFIAARDPTEATIAAIWAGVLGHPRVSVTADFFAIGGDSILSVQIVSRCRRAGLPIEPKDVFLHRTIAALAEALGRRAVPVESHAAVAAGSGLPPISPEQFKAAIGQVAFDER